MNSQRTSGFFLGLGFAAIVVLVFQVSMSLGQSLRPAEPFKDPKNFAFYHDDGFITVIYCKVGRLPGGTLDLTTGTGIADCPHDQLGFYWAMQKKGTTPPQQ